MGSKHIEMFHDRHPVDLESCINSWCRDHDYQPVSVSVAIDDEEFVAFVVVEEKDKTFDSIWTSGGLPL